MRWCQALACCHCPSSADDVVPAACPALSAWHSTLTPLLGCTHGAGEYGQDRGLLDASYHIFPCKAALFNLLSVSDGPC